MATRLSRRFYARPTLEVAEDLIGRTLFRETAEGAVAGRIVEVEAYLGSADPGSHAFKRRTPRNAVMFGPPGHLYVYFTYGMHYCCNVLTEQDGVAGAVLLRAVEPVQGLELMAARRGTAEPLLLTKGPARLCQAFALARPDNGADLVEGSVWIAARKKMLASLATSARIGLPADLLQPWRIFEPGPWVSGPKGLNRANA